MITELDSKLDYNQELTPERQHVPLVLSEGIDHYADNDQMQPSNTISPKKFSQDESVSIVISDYDKSEMSNSSPEIKKKYRNSDLRRKINRKRKTAEVNDGSFTPSELQLRSLIDVVQIGNASCKKKKGQNKEDNISMDFLDNFPPTYKVTQNNSQGISSPDRNNKIADTSQKHADLDFSIVQCTPKATQSKRKEEMPTHLLKNKSRGKRKLNPTQISIEKDEDEEIEHDLRSEDFKENSSLNSAMLEDSISEPEELPKGLNDFLAKARNVPNQLETEPITKGKARKKLPGWSCKECEKFYLKQGLNSDEIQVLNKCSKHRGYYKPREDTLPGFWDMDVSSQTQNI